MKKIIQKIFATTAALAGIVFTAQSQIIITEATFDRPIGFTDTYWLASETNLALPAQGANLSWDYSSLTHLSTFNDDYIDATSDVNFTTATNKQRQDYYFQIFNFKLQEYESVDANGWYEMGRFIEDTTITLQAVSGSASDSIRFVGGPIPYQGRIDIVQFPMNYQNQWTQSRVERFDFELSVGAFGLNSTPGNLKRYVTVSQEVVGYGDLVFPTQNGPSKPVQVLQTRYVRTAVDSFYLGGQLAPAALLTAFGVSQGMSDGDSSIVYYTQGFGAPVFEIELNGNLSNEFVWRPQAETQSTSSITELEFAKSNCYPNPANANENIYIESFELPFKADLTVLDVSGKVIIDQSIDKVDMSKFSFKMPADSPKGIYFYRLTDGNNKFTQGKILIQ